MVFKQYGDIIDSILEIVDRIRCAMTCKSDCMPRTQPVPRSRSQPVSRGRANPAQERRFIYA